MGSRTARSAAQGVSTALQGANELEEGLAGREHDLASPRERLRAKVTSSNSSASSRSSSTRSSRRGSAVGANVVVVRVELARHTVCPTGRTAQTTRGPVAVAGPTVQTWPVGGQAVDRTGWRQHV
jgi:hypothetical protein